MARVLRADQLPKSITRSDIAGIGALLEDFDGPDIDIGRLSGTASIPPEPTPEETLAENIIKAAELQAEELTTRAKNQADRLLEKAQEELNRAKAEAEKILGDAQTEATQIRKQARQEADQAFQKARSEGYEQGVAQGQKIALQERNAEIDHLGQTVQGFIEEIALFKEKLIAQCEAEILELVLVISTKIVGFELSIHPNLILEVVKNGIELLKDKREISIRLSPGDLGLVRKYRPELLKQIEGIGQVYLIADENLITGECLIENKSNLVDSTWRRKIGNAAEMVWELYNKRPPSEGKITDATTTN